MFLIHDSPKEQNGNKKSLKKVILGLARIRITMYSLSMETAKTAKRRNYQMGIAAVQIDGFNGRGSQFHLKNPKTVAEEAALIAGGSKVRFQNTPISKAEELENLIAARKRAAKPRKVKALDMPF